ncbi:MAG: hypothetical protein LXA50_14285 [Betaproteobacteria bacterium]|nr:hypothetical protein [Betaproteobacteria bacterium]
MSEPRERNRSCAPCWHLSLIGLVVVVVLAIASGRVAVAFENVLSGGGMDHCCTIIGVPFNNVALLVLLGSAAAGLLVASALELRELRLRREFERKHGVKLEAQRRSSGSSDAATGPSFYGYPDHGGD